MDMNYIFIAIGLAAMGYFIGEGLKNFGNPNNKDSLLNFDDDEPELIKEKDLHWTVNIDKTDIKALIEKYPDIPKIEVNGNTYYPRRKLMEWMEKNL